MGIVIDSRLVKKIDSIFDISFGCNFSVVVKFKDLDDSFHFTNMKSLQSFMNNQTNERFSPMELRKGYFDYLNENDEMLRYFVKNNKGNLIVLKEICINN